MSVYTEAFKRGLRPDPPSFRPESDQEKRLVNDLLDAAKKDQDKFIEILVQLFKARRWDIIGTCPGGILQDDLNEVLTELETQGCPEFFREYIANN